MDALELLDYPSWRLVFEKLDPEDLLSCRDVCKTFGQILDENGFQQRWKFHLVLPLIFDYLGPWDDDRGRTDWTDLQNSRLVCQSWRHSVDTYATEFGSGSLSWEFLYGYPLAIRFSSSEQIGEFIQTFGEWGGCPFPSKTVYISSWHEPNAILEEDEDNEDAMIGLQNAYIEKLSDFVERFGRHILNLNLDYFFFGLMDHLFACRLIQRITMHVPNLKRFCMRIRIPENAYDPQEVATWIEGNGLSDLPNLKLLQLDGLNEALENYLVEKYAEQLNHFRRTYFFPWNLLNQFRVQLFRNLNSLSLELLESCAETLEPLRFLESPLKRMRLFINNWNPDHKALTWNVDLALRNLKHLPIECLEFEFSQDVNVVEAGIQLQQYVNESVKTLSIHFNYFRFDFLFDEEDEEDEGEISFNFLQAFTKLERLYVTFDTVEGAISHPEEVTEEVELIDYMDDDSDYETPYQSNVWEKVSSLKTLIIQAAHGREQSEYTREEYEKPEEEDE